MKDNVNEALLGKDMFGEVVKPDIKGILKNKFLIPPFSVLSARDGDWQNRKRQWLQLGIQSEVGRGAPCMDDGAWQAEHAYNSRANINLSKGHDRGLAPKDILLRSGEGRTNLNLGMSHPETTSTIDFYSQKRKIEAELGHGISKDEAASILKEKGKLKDDRSNNRGLAQSNGQDLMKGENPNFRQEADKRSNLTGAPLKPEWATGTGTTNMAPGTSIFDPVLCELMYSWFCKEGGQILDPFCGGSVRGIVASVMGYKYWGCDLRQEQIDANFAQISLCGDNKPDWVVGDALDRLNDAPLSDFIFSCPPYGNLEVYSDNPKDISTMDFPKFITTLKEIIKLSCDKLKNNSFACIVVGDYRDKQGFYRCFPQHATRAFLDAGLKLYNEIILVTAVGSLPIRITKQFEAGRKIGKTHQNVLVFCKGNPPKFDI